MSESDSIALLLLIAVAMFIVTLIDDNDDEGRFS